MGCCLFDFCFRLWISLRYITFSILSFFLSPFLSFFLSFFLYPFHPRVTAVARKRPRSFCQKCRWQVTAKYACTLCMWLCIKWYRAYLYGVHRARRDGSSFMCGTSHASAVSTPLRWIFKNGLWKAVHSCRITCEHGEPARERRIALYKSDHHNHHHHHDHHYHHLSFFFF